MKVGVLGSSDVGKKLAGGFAARGHDVVVGTRRTTDPELAAWAKEHSGKVRIGSLSEAAQHGEIVVVAVHGDAAIAAIQSAGIPHFAGKVVIDVTNPLVFSGGGPPTLFVGTTDSLGEQIQHALPAAKVVKAFNTVGSPQMVNPTLKSQSRLELLIAGNDAGAKKQVTDIAQSFGWSGTIDAGGIDAARYLEAMIPLWVRLGPTLNTWNHLWIVGRD